MDVVEGIKGHIYQVLPTPLSSFFFPVAKMPPTRSTPSSILILSTDVAHSLYMNDTGGYTAGAPRWEAIPVASTFIPIPARPSEAAGTA